MKGIVLILFYLDQYMVVAMENNRLNFQRHDDGSVTSVIKYANDEYKVEAHLEHDDDCNRYVEYEVKCRGLTYIEVRDLPLELSFYLEEITPAMIAGIVSHCVQTGVFNTNH